jgi:hypothetical protein
VDHEAAISTLLDALYAQVSGPAGHRRDWSRQAEMFLPTARMLRTGVDEAGKPWALEMKAADYPANFEQMIRDAPFFEVEIHRVIQRFGNIAQVFSTYEAWRDAEHTDFIKRGINSVQLYNDGERWRVVNMIWDDEREGLAIDPAYLPG